MKRTWKRIVGRRSSSREHPQPVDTSPVSTINHGPDSNPEGIIHLSTPTASQIPGGESFEVDIVAIHGLNGDSRNTWTHKNGTLWLRDLLPNDIPGARIHSFGYPSKIFLDNCVGGVRDFAQALLRAIDLDPAINAGKRPIIYICHSLGGIVLKKAMIVAYDEYPDIYVRSKGVIFLGTPHRGSKSADLAAVISQIVDAAWNLSPAAAVPRTGRADLVKTHLLRTLSLGSEELMDISATFRHRANDMLICTFFEQRLTYPLRHLVVEKLSAVTEILHERSSPLWEDHRSMARYESVHSESYKTVALSLKQMAREILRKRLGSISSATTAASLDSSQKKCATILNSIDVAAFESTLEQPTAGTLEWIQSNPTYTGWINGETPNLLVVTGHSGCGKTVLANLVVSSLAESSDSGHIVCRHFFSGKTPDLSNQVVALRHILHQIVSQRPKLLRVIRRASDRQGFQMFERADALWNLLFDVMRKLHTETVDVVLDGIDECSEDSQTTFARRLQNLAAGTVHQGVRLLLTARPNTKVPETLREHDTKHVLLDLTEEQELVDRDIGIMIDRRLDVMLQRGRYAAKSRDTLRSFLLSNSDRTFLWVSLVLDLLERRKYIDPRELPALMAEIPKRLPDSYLYFVRSIPQEDLPLAKRVLQILSLGTRPLTVEELSTLLGVWDAGKDGPGDIFLRPETLYGLLGPLIKIIDFRISLTHQSVREFLLQLNQQTIPFRLDLEDAMIIMARSCMSYLAAVSLPEDSPDHTRSPSEHQFSPSSPTSVEDPSYHLADVFDLADITILEDDSHLGARKTQKLTSEHKLYDYAARNWCHHYKQSESSSEWTDRSLFLSICNRTSPVFRTWWSYSQAFDELSDSYPRDPDPLVVASFFDLECTLEDLFASLEYSEWDIGGAVYWASQRGHSSSLRVMLDRADLGYRDCCKDSQSPLFAAAKGGHNECFEILADSDYFSINERSIGGRTPLSAAVGNGHLGLVRLILKRSPEINLPDALGSTPLLWAASGDSPEMLRALLRCAAVSVHHVDMTGRNALSWAASDGSLECLDTLIRDHRVDINNRDSKGRTPLIFAVQEVRSRAVRRLLADRRTVSSAKDRDGRNAISWASDRNSSEILQRLLKADPDGADERDIDGWAPLAWALNTPGYTENVSLLLRSDKVDPDRTDDFGRSAISFSAGYGYPQITRLLANQPRVNIDRPDSDGRTPLSHAAGNGHCDVIEFLVKTGKVELNSCDSNNMTCLDWAERGGWTDAVKLIRKYIGLGASGDSQQVT